MKIIAVTTDRMPIPNLIQTLVAIEPYVDAVILREKSKTDADLLALIQAIRETGFDIKKITIHGNPALASAEHIQNVQLPGLSPPLSNLRGQFPMLSFGKSVHSFEEAKLAATEGASSILYGHLFNTYSKAGLPPRGTDELRQIASSLEIPVYAVGGIKPSHIRQLRSLNIAGVAVMSSIFNSINPKEVAKSYYDAIHLKGDFFHD